MDEHSIEEIREMSDALTIILMIIVLFLTFMFSLIY